MHGEYASSLTTPSEIRHEVARTLDEWFVGDTDVLISEATLVVSELATNCVQAGAHQIDLAVDTDGAQVTLRLEDDGTGTPRMGDAPATAVHGRGLYIVSALSARWGVECHDHSKTVWAQLDVPSSVTGRLAS